MMRGQQSMDEVGLIRQQDDTEHAHLSEVVSVLGREYETIDPLNTNIYLDYLVYYMQEGAARLDARARRLLRGAAAMLAPDRTTLEAVAELKERLALELSELEQMRTRGGDAQARRAQIGKRAGAALEMLDRMRAATGPLALRYFTLADWRQTARFTADSVLAERQRFARLMTLRGQIQRSTIA